MVQMMALNVPSQGRTDVDAPPIIDLSSAEEVLVEQIAKACSTWGFFQVVGHDVPLDLVQRFKAQVKEFFALPRDIKMKLKRDQCNARGFFDDELTKQRRDWKEALDIGMPGSRDWSTPDNVAGESPAENNACLDGFNRFPDTMDAPNFRSTVVEYFGACADLADRIAILMATGLGVRESDEDSALLQNLRSEHTSYLRMNYYPPFRSNGNGENSNEPPPLGISPHRDAGFLTVLVQDDDCHSLQVARPDDGDDPSDWRTVKPVPGAFTINTGDMCMIWSNGRYKAPLHRVRTDPNRKRYSAPFFYNPGYSAEIAPLQCLREEPKYHPCSWGYFRATRFAGDLTDLGVEIQTSDFKVGSNSLHPEKQGAFLKEARFDVSFNVERYRPLLEAKQADND